MESEKSNLYIPVNIRRRKEYTDGFGKEELIVTITWGLIGIAVGIFLYLIMHELLTIIISVVVFSGGAFVFNRKDKTNRSSIDHIKASIDFAKSTKRYDYKYNNIYEKEGVNKSV